jgi:peptide deformylase|tara:strand:+ start:5756 stop:6292 length:537 start_codon:yes stop_codon:yes gene_type:complete
MYELVTQDDPILKQKCELFDFKNPQMDPRELADLLKQTMVAKMGVGLAANQIGLPYRVFAIGDPTDPANIEVVFNPKVVFKSEVRRVLEEGCLSYPGMFISVRRPIMIRVRVSDADGNMATKVYDGFPARAFLHEHDHLEGISYFDRAGPVAVSRGKKQKIKLDRLRKRRQAHESNKP